MRITSMPLCRSEHRPGLKVYDCSTIHSKLFLSQPRGRASCVPPALMQQSLRADTNPSHGSTATAPAFGLGTQGNGVPDESSSRHCSVSPSLVKQAMQHTGWQTAKSLPLDFRRCCDTAVNQDQVKQNLYPNSGSSFCHHSWKTAVSCLTRKAE